MFNKFFCAIFVAFVLFGCTTTRSDLGGDVMHETLELEILSNTSKMFVYRLRLPEEKMLDAVRISRGVNEPNEARGAGVSVGRSTQKQLHDQAGEVVKNLGYCKEGFLEIDSSASRYHLWLKGECKEGATDDDRKKFGDKQTLTLNKKNN